MQQKLRPSNCLVVPKRIRYRNQDVTQKDFKSWPLHSLNWTQDCFVENRGSIFRWHKSFGNHLQCRLLVCWELQPFPCLMCRFMASGMAFWKDHHCIRQHCYANNATVEHLTIDTATDAGEHRRTASSSHFCPRDNCRRRQFHCLISKNRRDTKRQPSFTYQRFHLTSREDRVLV